MENVMVSKIYTVICILFALTAAVLFATGNFPATTAIVFGFAAFGLVFMGMMFVLPYSISHAAPIPPKKEIDVEVMTGPARMSSPTSVHARQALTRRPV